MFGYFRFKKTLNFCNLRIDDLFAPARINGNLPLEAYADAYVLGFLQPYISNFIYILNGNIKNNESIRVYGACLNNLIPGQGHQILSKLPELNQPSHFGNANYMTGQNDGKKYVEAMANSDNEKMDDILLNFTLFLKRNYMGL